MRTLLLGAASLVAVLAPGAANAQVGGYVDLSMGQMDAAGEDLDTLTIGGAAAADVSDNWRAQFDVSVNRLSEGGADLTLTNGAAHLYYEGGNWAAGGVLTNVDLGFGSVWAYGLEGQMTFGQFVVEGEANIGSLEVFDESVDTSQLSLDGTFYLMENLSIGAGVSSLDIDEVFDGSVTTWNANAEWQFDGANSVFFAYSQTDFDDVDEETDSWRIGVRHAFGSDTLQGRRQTGPRWLPISTNFFQFIT